MRYDVKLKDIVSLLIVLTLSTGCANGLKPDQANRNQDQNSIDNVRVNESVRGLQEAYGGPRKRILWESTSVIS